MYIDRKGTGHDRSVSPLLVNANTRSQT